MHSFYVNINNPDSAVKRASREVAQVGGTFQGDENAGVFSGKGIKGNYRRESDNRAKITITDKPFFIPNSLVETTIKEFFAA